MNTAIKCPDCGQLAILYRYPHQYAGIWECQNEACGASDTHDHTPHLEIETIEVDDSHPDRSDGYTYQAYVCTLDGVQIPLDEASPAEDRAEAIADSQIMQALGK